MSRQDVVNAAAAEMGSPTPEKLAKYWASDSLGPNPDKRLAWCGIFALYCLHAAGLDLDEPWRIGAGFILQQPHPLPVTHDPQPGDIGYQAAPFQHHFVVEAREGNLIHSIDGNQPDIRRKTRSLGPALTFYSIAPLLALAEQNDTLPDPAAPIHHRTTPAEVQHAVNNLIVQHLLDGAPGLLTVDGVIGPKSESAIEWAQGVLKVPVTGKPDDVTCKALGLS